MIIFHHDPCCVLDQPVYGKVKIGQGQEFVHQSNQKLYTVYFGEEVLIGDSILDKVKITTQVLFLGKICVQTGNQTFNNFGNFLAKVSF